MPTDPVCGMEVSRERGIKLIFRGEEYFFCCKDCLNKFRSENNITDEFIYHPPARPKKHDFLKNKTFITALIILFFIISGFLFKLFEPLKNNLINYLKIITLPIFLGLFIGGIIDWLIPRVYISKILARRDKKTVFYAVITGFFMSACSHGILALAIQLYKKGASAPAVVAFLLASPWANLPLTILIIGFFGIKGLIFVFSAIIIALITGYIFLILERHNLVEINPNTTEGEEPFSIISDAKNRIKNTKFNKGFFRNGIRGIFSGSVSLGNMVLWWIFIGVLISSVVGAYVPTGWMEKYMGASFIGILVTLGIATIMEVCSEGTAPLAFEIFKKTGAIGNSFVFLMAGVPTDYTEIGLLWTHIGKKTAIWLPVITVPQIVILGIIFNYFL